MNSKYPMRISAAVVISLILLTGVPLSSHARSGDLAGEWMGFVENNGEKIKTTLKVESAGGGGKTYSLHYGPPRSCKLEAEAITEEKEDPVELALKEASGGFCDKLWRGKMTLERQSKKSLLMVIKSKTGAIDESSTLAR